MKFEENVVPLPISVQTSDQIRNNGNQIKDLEIFILKNCY